MSDHPELILDAPLFFGIEQEGPRKGMRTLFVNGPDVPIFDILLAAEKYEAEQVYLGAARCSPWNQAQFQTILRDTELKVSVECPMFTVQTVSSLITFIEAQLEAGFGDRFLMIATLLMLKPGELVPLFSIETGDAFALAAHLMNRCPNNVVLKIDAGQIVHILGAKDSYSNGFSDYSKDVVVTL